MARYPTHILMYDFIQQNLLLFALFVTSGVMLVWPGLMKMAGGSPALGTLDVTRLMNAGNALVLDIRDSREFDAGRIPKAKNIPLSELPKRMEELARFKERTVVICGSGVSRAAAAIKLLRAQGFTTLHELEGGFASWQQASLPIEK